MIIDADFTEKIRKTGVDDQFIRALSEAYEKFCQQIMMELTDFKYDRSTFGFSDLGLVSREYAIQKYFEPRLETYVRRFFVTEFFENVFEERDYIVDTPTYYVPDDQFVEGEIFCSNKEYEDNCGFEFVLHDGNSDVGFRMTDVHSWDIDKFMIPGLVNKIIIIDWNNIDGISDDEKARRLYGITKDVDILGINQFISMWLGEAESKAYQLFVKEALQRYQETIGISSLPKLTAPVLFELRLEKERDVLKEFVSETQIQHRKEQEQTASTIFEAKYAYRIIDPNNFSEPEDVRRSQRVEENSKQLLFDAGVLEFYDKQKMYKAFIGRSDFAKSFLTSEYLYSQYNENDLFDYTSIVSGYLKSIEQLLSTVVFCFADQGLRIKSNGRKNRNGDYPASSRREGKVFKMDLSSQEAECVDTTIGSLIHFVRDNKDILLRIADPFKTAVIDCLECYRIECRNDSFHSHNNYDWDRVETIRHNTLVLYTVILGAFHMGDDQRIEEKLNIISEDRLERIYYWLRKKRMYTFRLKFQGDNDYYLATRKAEDLFPAFDNNGLLDKNFSIQTTCSNESNKGLPSKQFIISRSSLPAELWYTTFVESYPVDFSM